MKYEGEFMPPENEDYLFLKEDENEQQPEPDSFWDILIVDDDPEIHSVTKLALSGVELWQRTLRFHHAYSGQEAVDYLIAHPDIAVVLLDVVMETDDAGLVVVKKVREELENHNVRIILRTGQPGHAPEEEVIRKYDINDYKTKTELTRSKLLTCLVTALRSYQQFCQMAAQTKALEDVLYASEAILGITKLSGFAESVVTQLANIMDCEPLGIMCGTLDDSGKLYVYGGSRQFFNEPGIGLEQLDDGRVISQVKACLKSGEHQFTPLDLTLLVKGKNRKAAIYLECAAEVEPGQRQFIDLFLTNVSVGLDNVQLFNRLRDVAYKDTLTGLANRSAFVECLSDYANAQNQLCLMLLDIAHFSDINNGLGQDIGNCLLQAVAHRLQQEVPESEILARIGADVFALLVPIHQLDIDLFNEMLSTPFQAGEHLLPVDFFIGMCEQADFKASGLDTIKLAYIALNQAKKLKQSNYCTYTPDMEEQMTWRLGVIRQLRTDFEEGKLQVWYQPQLDLDTLEVIGCEALLRWPSGNGNYISPAVFVPLAEDAGLIGIIGQWVLEQACQLQNRLQQLGVDIHIAVNVSVPQFKASNYAAQVKETLTRFGISPHQIELEVTESVVMDELGGVIETLTELKEFGIEIALDDFGTGFSSLSYLQTLPLNRLKIDRSFVKDLPDEDAGAIASLIIALGKKLGLRTIAEGIETEEQAAYLKRLGCQEAQGFLYAKPMPVDELEAYLKDKSQPSE